MEPDGAATHPAHRPSESIPTTGAGSVQGPHGDSPPAPPIAVERLSKRFGAITVVEDLTFSVQRGEVCGLLGPNGAGKTTTLRMIVGLVRADAGAIDLLGTPVHHGSTHPQLGRVGVLIEQAAFVPHLSGRTNLRLWWQAGGGRLEDADLEGALALAGLGSAIERKVRTYSQGMRQRLGLARLLLGRPEVLILDEPTSGLDPAEIREFRELLGRLARERGATVLLSSHHLAEVEQICTHVVILDRGRLVRAGAVGELTGAGGVYLEVDDRARAREILAGLPTVRRVVTEADGLALEMSDGRRSDLVDALVAGGVKVDTISARHDLEETFLSLLRGGES